MTFKRSWKTQRERTVITILFLFWKLPASELPCRNVSLPWPEPLIFQEKLANMLEHQRGALVGNWAACVNPLPSSLSWPGQPGLSRGLWSQALWRQI